MNPPLFADAMRIVSQRWRGRWQKPGVQRLALPEQNPAHFCSERICLRKLVYSVIYDSGQVSLENFLLLRYPESINDRKILSSPYNPVCVCRCDPYCIVEVAGHA